VIASFIRSKIIHTMGGIECEPATFIFTSIPEIKHQPQKNKKMQAATKSTIFG